jgi:GYF domain 2
MADQWYVARGKEKFGPFSAVQLKALASQGRLSPTDMLHQEGMPKWVAASSVQGLFAATTATTAPPPLPIFSPQPGNEAKPPTSAPAPSGAASGAAPLPNKAKEGYSRKPAETLAPVVSPPPVPVVIAGQGQPKPAVAGTPVVMEGGPALKRSSSSLAAKVLVGLVAGAATAAGIVYLVLNRPQQREPQSITLHIAADSPLAGQNLRASVITDLTSLPPPSRGGILAAGRFEPDGLELPGGLEVTWKLSEPRKPGSLLWSAWLDRSGKKWIGTGEAVVVSPSGREAAGTVHHFSEIGVFDGPPDSVDLFKANAESVTELLGDAFATAARTEDGLGLKSVYNPRQSKVTKFDKTGGNGFDNVYLDERNSRLVILEAKSGNAQLGHVKDPTTGRPIRQGTVEWIDHVLNRMEWPGHPPNATDPGILYDRERAKYFRRFLRQGDVDVLLFRLPRDVIDAKGKGGLGGTWERSPALVGKVPRPNPQQGGVAGTWVHDAETGKPRLDKLKLGKVGCSDCQVGSRFFELAAKKKLDSDHPLFKALRENRDEGVNPYYLLESEGVFDKDFQQARSRGLAESEKVTQALEKVSPEERAGLRARLRKLSGEHFEKEKTKSLIDRQRFWQEKLGEHGRTSVRRTRGLVDELKGDANGLRQLHRLLLAGQLAQLAWAYYSGGTRGLYYALGNMVEEQIKQSIRDQALVFLITRGVARGFLPRASLRVATAIETGNLALIWMVAEFAYHAASWLTETLIYSEEYDAEARLICERFLRRLRADDFRGRKPPVTFANLADRDIFASKKKCMDRLAQYRKADVYQKEAVWQKVEAGVEQSWLKSKANLVAHAFFTDLAGGLSPNDFCDRIPSEEVLEAGFGRLRHLHDPEGELTEEQWAGMVAPIRELYQRCVKTRPLREGLRARLPEPKPGDLARLDDRPGKAPPATAALLAAEESQLAVKPGRPVRLRTSALVWGLPHTTVNIEFASYLEPPSGRRRAIRKASHGATFGKDAVAAEELTQVLVHEDQFSADAELATGACFYVVELMRDGERVGTRRVRLAAPSKGYRLTKIEVFRSYGGNIGRNPTGTHAIKLGKQVGEKGPYTIGWGYMWGDKNANRNYCTATLTVTEFPQEILPGKQVNFKAVMKGNWDTSGYAVDRSVRVEARGIFGSNSYRVKYDKTPSGKYQGTFALENKYKLLVDHREPIVFNAYADLYFGDDHYGYMAIKWVFEKQP